MTLICATVVIANQRGVHGRVAARLAEVVKVYGGSLRLVKGEEGADCASILDILSLELVCGCAVRVEAEGPRAVEALAAAKSILAAQDDP